MENIGAFGIFFMEKFCVPVSHHMNQFFFCDDSGCKNKGNSVLIEILVGDKGDFKICRPALVFIVDTIAVGQSEGTLGAAAMAFITPFYGALVFVTILVGVGGSVRL